MTTFASAPGLRHSPFPFIDRRALPAYFMILATYIIGSAAVWYLGVEVDSNLRIGLSFSTGLLLVAGLVARRGGWPRLGGWLETTSLTVIFAAAATLLLCAALAVSGPFVDPLLARGDALLGFHWPDAAEFFMNDMAIARVAQQLYRSYLWQGPLLLALLFYMRRDGAAWGLLTGGMVGVLFCAAVLPVTPAEGPLGYFKAGHVGLLADTPAWRAGDAIRAFKFSEVPIIDESVRGGLVAIPSFHTIAAVLYVRAAWSTPLRLPLVILNAGMVCATVVVGNHYLVDVLAGLAIAPFVCWATHCLTIRSTPTVYKRGDLDSAPVLTGL